MAFEDIINWRDYRINSYTNESFAKTGKNWLKVFPGDFLVLRDWVIDIAQPSDIIEWVSIQVDTYANDNETNEKKNVIYRPTFILHTYVCDLESWSFIDSDVGKFFAIAPGTGQYIDYSTKDTTGWQVRLEKILSEKRGEFRIVSNFGNNMWPQWLTGATGLTGATWPQWPQGNKWLKWDAGDTPDHEWNWTSLRFENPDGSRWSYVNLIWPQWLKGNQWDQWDPGPQGIPWQSFIRKWPYSWSTTYAVREVVEYQWSSYVSITNGNIGTTPWSSPTTWELVAQKGATWPQGVQWPVWPSGWPMWPMPWHQWVGTALQFQVPWWWYWSLTDLQWPAWPQGPSWLQWQDWADGVQWPPGPQGPMINEFIQMRKSWDQTKSFSGNWSDEFIVQWQNTYTGNNAMNPPWSNKNYIIASTDMTAFVSCSLRSSVRVIWVPDDIETVRTTIRMFLFVTDSTNNIKYSHFWFIDTKHGSIEPANYAWSVIPKEWSLSWTAIIPLDAWDRVRVLFRFSNDVNPSWGTVLWTVEWPVGIPSSPSLWVNAWSTFSVRKIFNKI